MSRIAVIGGGGYLGLKLVDHLIDQGHEVYVFVRKNAEILVRNPMAIIGKNTPPTGGFDIVVNLAYPSGGRAYRAIVENKAIFEKIKNLAGKNTRIIHTSTFAVFGYALDREQFLSLLKKRRDYLYVELKIDMEHRLAKTFNIENLDIVRLGNLWGPGSPKVTGVLANKTLFGHPVLNEAEDGYSNITDVNNVVSYISFLAELQEPSSMTFHHLAELSDIKWSFWINHFAELLAVKPVKFNTEPEYPSNIGEELRDLFLFQRTGAGLLERLRGRRFIGSYLRSIFARLPDFVITFLGKNFQPGITGGTSNDLFYIIMSCPVKFECVVDNRWQPELDAENSWQKVKEWAEQVGYLN